METLLGIPKYVDKIFVIDDGSDDGTATLVRTHAIRDSRVYLISHAHRMGLGKSLIDGYCEALAVGCEVIAVMAGDNQMHPDDLEAVISPVCSNRADYVKGNRLLNPDTWSKMPKYRFLGNAALSMLTKFATGYWKSIDPQCGYTAISSEILREIPISEMLKGYGYNASILHMLNLKNARVADVTVKAVYGREKSKIKVLSYTIVVSRLLCRLFVRRIWKKHVITDFHPLSLFYFAGLVSLFGVSAPLLGRIILKYTDLGYIPTTSLMLFTLSFFSGTQFLLHAISLDINENRGLWVDEGRRQYKNADI